MRTILLLLTLSTSVSAQTLLSAPVGVGTAPDPNYTVWIGGSSTHDGVYVGSTLNPTDGIGAAMLHAWGWLNFTGAQPFVSTLKVDGLLAGTGTPNANMNATLWVHTPAQFGNYRYLAKFEGGGNVFVNANCVMVARNRPDSNCLVSQYLTWGSDGGSWDQSRAGNMVFDYFAPTQRLESSADHVYGRESHCNITSDGNGPYDLNLAICHIVDATYVSSGVRAAKVIGTWHKAQIAGLSQNITDHFEGVTEFEGVDMTTLAPGYLCVDGNHHVYTALTGC